MDAKDFVEALRKVLVDVLVPEIRDVRTEIQELHSEMDKRFAEMDKRFAKMDERFAKMDERFAKMDERFARMDGKLDILIERDRRFDEVLRLDVRLEVLEKKVEKLIAA
ncbi:MAG: hypothetical protein COS94_00590 [Candidatus Hydrogenedentes bacterium CG07_land_8_20_14_0_80_42_17]|nr:MAG: hypothetical protein COS94_00590 [Candidatus Hydrogenedentes bacterium CG07_land_8_20_14_0_80_42_17]